MAANKLVLEGFYGNNVYKMFTIDGESYAVELTPYEQNNPVKTPVKTNANGNSVITLNELTLKLLRKIKISDVEKLEKTLKTLEQSVYEIESSCIYCDKRTRTAYGFKLHNKYYIWSDLLLHIITEHKINISLEFLTGIFNYLNPWHSNYNFHNFKTYVKSEAPLGASLITTAKCGYADGHGIQREQIIPKVKDVSIFDKTYQFVYPLYPAPIFKDYQHTHEDKYRYIAINQSPATPENLQIVNYCDECIETLFGDYGVDMNINKKHSACMWDGVGFVTPNKNWSYDLCGRK